jgi:predicted O-linked N-acetylglucosamine transferase (SPINDLY family)
MNVRSSPAKSAVDAAAEYAKNFSAAVSMEKARRLFEARQLYLAAVKSKPGDGAALEGAARMAAAAGEHRVAIEHLRAALAADPKRSSARERLIGGLLHISELASAEEEAQIALGQAPNEVTLLNMLGVIQKRRGRFTEAMETFRKGIALEPSNHSPWYNLGNTFLTIGEFPQAAEALKRASELKKDSETTRLYGQALIGMGEHDMGMAAFARASQLDPKNCRVHTSRAVALQRIGAPDAEVLAEIDSAIALEPNNAEHMRSKAAYFQRRSRFADAEAVHKELLAKNPDDIETLLRLGHLLGYSLRRYEEANGFLRHALALRPDDPRCLSGLCKSLLDSRYGVESDHIEEAGKVAHQLVATGTDLKPHAANLSGVFLRLADYAGLDALGDRGELMAFWVDRMNVGSLHNQLGRVVTPEDRRVLVHWHREWGRRVEEQAAKTPIKRPPPRPALRSKIRIGLMSSDLRDHPVAYFALPIIEHYDRDRFEFICYSFYPAPPDRVQSFMQQRVLGFRSMLQATDVEIAQQIADDELDILFELGGSTRYNRLEVLAYRAAPLQASWLGYPHSAGIGAIDYIMVDPYLKPDDPALLIEKPFVMPESWVCLGRLGFREEPIEAGTPEERAGALTFGTMNNPYKYTPELFALWAEVMNRVPGSRFLFVRPEAGAPTFRANIAREFGKHGVGEDRLMFESVRGKHMRHYNRIDIALDSAPHTGGTTTCETLWMGCPTVTLVGEAFFERLSYSNLSNAGLGDLCGFTREQYVQIAVDLAKDRARRLDLRQNLRESLRTSPLGDAQRWVKNFELTIDRT